MATFFVSYTAVDISWAEWIAWTVEAQGHVAILQAWDFRPGSNFVIEMQRATTSADATIAVLSPDYLRSAFASPEWAAAFASDPMGHARKLIPVRVRDCRPEGLLKGVVYVDLIGVPEEVAGKKLDEALRPGRAKPSLAPSFPGAAVSAKRDRVAFPGSANTALSRSNKPYMPQRRRKPSDLDKRKFLHGGFGYIRNYFEDALKQLQADNVDIESHVFGTTSEFNAEIFVAGTSKSRCRIWIGGVFGDEDIAYAEGSAVRGGAMNESLAVSAERGEPAFRSLMTGFARVPAGVDTEHMSVEQAAEYLWRRFVGHLEY